MQRPLPTKLDREPLVDAVFEMRLRDIQPLADILPGFLMAKLEPKPKVSRLPAAEIPQPLRANDPNLKFAPIQRVELEGFQILVGDRNIVIGCKLPYPKWPNFRKAILDITNHIAQMNISGEIERYSLKYVNLVPDGTIEGQLNKIKINITLGDIEVSKENISLQIQQFDDDTLHILTVSTGAEADIPETGRVKGIIVDIDSIKMIDPVPFEAFGAILQKDIDTLRASNKKKFFACLTDDTIENMGPSYE